MNELGDNQDAVFDLLGNPETYGGKEVRRIDTHGAAVFLAGDRVYKVKRAVRFPFLDFSTLDKRKAACLAELDVNRAFAPELYLGVVPIARNQQGILSLNGAGEPVEWAVEMRRFDESQTLDRLAGAIDEALAEKLAAAVAAMHEQAKIVDARLWLEALDAFVGQNTQAFSEMPELFHRDAVARLESESRSCLRRLRPLLLARGRLGLVRRGHGDLHLGNIALIDGKPVPFDALEFDPIVASGDVLYDLAFLLMDLVERGMSRAANIVLNRYFAEMRRPEDIDALAALPLFLSLRAAIRAKVTAARIENARDSDRAKIRASARQYFELSVRLIVPPPPRLIAVGGLSGTGKSLLARQLACFVAPEPGALVVRSDVERKHLFGVVETESLAPETYSAETSAKVYEVVFEKALRIVAAGHSAIVDAVFAKESERRAIAAKAAAMNVDFLGLFLAADLETRVKRVGSRVLDASDADAKVARRQEQFAIGRVDWAGIDASGTPAETLTRARAAL